MTTINRFNAYLKDRFYNIIDKTISVRNKIRFILNKRILKEPFYLLLTLVILPMIYRNFAYGRLFPSIYWCLRDYLLGFPPEILFIQIDYFLMKLLNTIPFYMFVLILIFNISWFQFRIYEKYNEKGRRKIYYIIIFIICSFYVYLIINGPLWRGILIEKLYNDYKYITILILIIMVTFLSILFPFNMIGISIFMFIDSLLQNMEYWYPYPIMASAINSIYRNINAIVITLVFALGSFVKVFGPGYALLSNFKNKKFLGLARDKTILLSLFLIVLIYFAPLFLNINDLLTLSDLTVNFLKRLQFFISDPVNTTKLQIYHVLFSRWRFFLFIGALFGFLINLIDNKFDFIVFLCRWIFYSSWLIYIFVRPFLYGGWKYRHYGIDIFDYLIMLAIIIWMSTSFLSNILKLKDKFPFFNDYTLMPWTFLFISSLTRQIWFDKYYRSYPTTMDFYEPSSFIGVLIWKQDNLFALFSVVFLGLYLMYQALSSEKQEKTLAVTL